ncbi:hypothetical protein ABH994_008117 [Bradyrhizobium yuanmingense]|uniref:Uncharacterized protein n=1 Tax=Bradyrhizobium yuanmingense TaxID=108015 RepID=A0ABV4G726_9BRAD|nr:hypothetical protein [Bradyrhizobium yuanmingense]
MIPVKQFDMLKFGTPRDAIVEMLGSPPASHGVKTVRKTVGGNNKVAIADGYVREDVIYGDHGLQFVNGTLTGKYRYFTPPKRLLIRNK